MNYKVLLLRLLANINVKRVVGALLGFFVYTVGAATDNIPLVVAGLTIAIIELWDLYESKD
jgi:hypothetical protein